MAQSLAATFPVKGMLACLSIALALVSMSEARHPEIILRMLAKSPCQDHNTRLFTFLEHAKEESGHLLLPHLAESFTEFVMEVKAALDRHPLEMRAIEYIFSDASPFNPTCSGMWAEFGVASGDTLNLAARFRRARCSSACPSVHGFDTFTGLPEDWVTSTKTIFEKTMFDQGGDKGGLPQVEPNVQLVKGLFNESIPGFLKELKAYAGSATALSYLHVDCDLYAGTRDILDLLHHKIVVGTVIVFDELVNYEYFMEHEIKAMWEWLQVSGVKLIPLGILGPLPDKNVSVLLDWKDDPERASSHHHQSAAFVVAEINSVH